MDFGIVFISCENMVDSNGISAYDACPVTCGTCPGCDAITCMEDCTEYWSSQCPGTDIWHCPDSELQSEQPAVVDHAGDHEGDETQGAVPDVPCEDDPDWEGGNG